GGSGGESGSEGTARRGVQAEEFAVFFSGAWRRSAEAAAGSWGEVQAAGDQRSNGDLADSDDAALRGYSAGRRAQHGELQFAARIGEGAQAGAAEAGDRSDFGRGAAVGGIHHGGRKL